MKLSELKNKLAALTTLNFVLPNGTFIPRHFHITEMGLASKHFIDCGGKIHTEQAASIQIWVAADYDHRLKPSGLANIIDISKKVLGDTDLEVEVEYQTDTVGKYGVDFDGENFVLVAKNTDCLAKSTCGTSEKEPVLEGTEAAGCCKPGGGCC